MECQPVQRAHPADAGAHPGAVVVKLVHAVVAHGAVRAARRAVVAARAGEPAGEQGC